MILKIAGGMLVILSCSGMGIDLSSNLRERRNTAEQLRQMIFMLKGEILYANAPLIEAFEQVGKKCGGPLGELFIKVAGRIEQQCGEPFYILWREEIQMLPKHAALIDRDRQELISFGEHLGYLDRQMQERTILLYLEQLDMTISYLREHQSEKCRLYTSLGIMCGIFLTIVMC